MRCRRIALAMTLILVVGSRFEGHGGPARPSAPPSGPNALPRPKAESRDFGRMPLQFIPNRGQVDARAAYYLQGRDKAVYFAAGGLTFVLSGAGAADGGRPASRYALKLDFLGADPDARPAGEGETGAVVSYFTGKEADWRTGLPTYSRIVYRNLWPGIDLAYAGTQNRLKYAFVVSPGADPALIRLAYRGAGGLTVNAAGGLAVETPAGGFEDEPPAGYQEIDGRRTAVPLAYRIEAPAGPASGPSAGAEEALAYGFEVGAYDPTRPLVLDPAVRVYCGYIGGAAADEARDIAVDRLGCVYVVGTTVSAQPSFPVKTGPDLTNNGGNEILVAKVNASGSSLVYCGFLGGKKDDVGQGIAVDARGNAYITGHTESAEDSFPVKVGPDLTHNGGDDAFVAKVNIFGTKLAYCGYIGGYSFDDRGRAVAVDSRGCAYVVGSAWSNEASFPVKVGPDLTHNGNDDAFVAKVSASGIGLVYCGYIGGSEGDHAMDVAVDSTDCAYVVGWALSSQATFPDRTGPDLTYGGGTDAFVAKVNNKGSGLVYCGYIGGSGYDEAHGVAVDAGGRAYISGTTDSTPATFPKKVGPDLTWNGDRDAFVAKVYASGAGLSYCGYIGGKSGDSGTGIVVDKYGNAYTTGRTNSNSRTFPVRNGPDSKYHGGGDAFVAKVKAGGAGLSFCGYIGGSSYETGNDIVLDASGSVYIAGVTASSEATFPVKAGPDLTLNGDQDGFVVKIKNSLVLRKKR